MKTTIWKQAKTFRHKKGLYGSIQETDINTKKKHKDKKEIIQVEF